MAWTPPGRGEDPPAFLADLAARLRPSLYRDGTWWVDYRRLRVAAVLRR
ncbi:MAG: hypothetical protein ACRDP8_02125 [Actinopolymorphaceae bacterium]